MAETTKDGDPWAVIIEPQNDEQKLLIITAYKIEPL